MSQTSRQNANISIEIDFFKLLINANFGCKIFNNFCDCTFEPISDEIVEIYYRKKHFKLFKKLISNFVNSDLIIAEIEKTYSDKLKAVQENVKISYLKTERLENLEAGKQIKIKE